jgi:NAD(P)-dependent dehydrogenase (short-subunit alcohol dehydrogenase family)
MPGKLDQRATLTGAVGGIGAVYVRRLSEARASMAVADLDSAGGEKVAAELRPAGVTATSTALDVGLLDAPPSLRKKVHPVTTCSGPCSAHVP